MPCHSAHETRVAFQWWHAWERRPYLRRLPHGSPQKQTCTRHRANSATHCCVRVIGPVDETSALLLRVRQGGNTLLEQSYSLVTLCVGEVHEGWELQKSPCQHTAGPQKNVKSSDIAKLCNTSAMAQSTGSSGAGSGSICFANKSPVACNSLPFVTTSRTSGTQWTPSIQSMTVVAMTCSLRRRRMRRQRRSKPAS